MFTRLLPSTIEKNFICLILSLRCGVTYYMGKLFVAFARIPIEGISDGTKALTRN
jgi:hypothetical protein